MAPLDWTPGLPAPGLPAPLPEPVAPVVHPELVSEIGAFRQRLRDYLRSNGGQQSKLNPAKIAAKGPLGQSTLGSNGLMGGPQVQTQGKRAGAIVQQLRLGGRVYHIYFHADGKREVIAMPKTPAQPTGGMLAP